MSNSDVHIRLNNKINRIRYIAIILLLSSVAINIAFVLSTTDKLLDFGSFIASGKNFSAGINPYDENSPLIFQTEYADLGIGGKLPNLNPPISVLFFIPLSHVNPLTAATTWRLFSFGFYTLAVVLLWKTIATNKSYLIILWGFSLAGFWHTIQLGQIYTTLFLALTLVLAFEKRGKYLVAGILAGFIVALKPNFLIWILLLVVSRNWKIAVPTITSFAVLSAIPAIVLGPDIYLQWLDASSLDSRILGMPGNNSLPGLTSRVGYIESGFYLGGLLVTIYSILIFKKRDTLKDNVVHELGIVLSLLCSPISWTGYTILLAPFFFYRKEWSPLPILSAAILAVPFIFPLFLFDNSRLNFVFWGWFYGWAILLLLFETSKESGLFHKLRKVMH